ncbi:hypothetical protein GCK32_017939, partial [Trichostrongylus colubriformis]
VAQRFVQFLRHPHISGKRGGGGPRPRPRAPYGRKPSKRKPRKQPKKGKGSKGSKKKGKKSDKTGKGKQSKSKKSKKSQKEKSKSKPKEKDKKRKKDKKDKGGDGDEGGGGGDDESGGGDVADRTEQDQGASPEPAAEQPGGETTPRRLAAPTVTVAAAPEVMAEMREHRKRSRFKSDEINAKITLEQLKVL